MNWLFDRTRLDADGWPYSPRFVDGLSGRDGQILRATFECIVEKGLAHTSTHAVAQRAGISQGFIHYHFKSKENLLLRLAESLCEWATLIDGVSQSDLSGIDKIRLLIRLWRPVETRNEEFKAILALWTHANAVKGPILDVMRGFFRYYRDTYESIAAQGHAEGSLTDEAAALLPGILVAMPWGLGLQTTIEPGCIEWDRLVEAALATLTVEPLGGQTLNNTGDD